MAERVIAMETLDALGAIWPLAFTFVTVVVVLAKQHADTEQLKEKVKILFELWNNRDK